jgi:dihydrolipoamide dehydrogenase
MAAETDFDLIVIGSGPGGYICAIRAAQLGLRTACVEYEETLGGTCLNVGCIPSKALLQSSENYSAAEHELAKHGVVVKGLQLDLAQMMKRKEEIVKGLTGGIAGLFKKNKITWLKGRGSFVDAHTIKVTGSDGAVKNYTSVNTVIATGSKPIEIPSAKYDRKMIVSSTGALKFSEVPKHLLVIGGGVIGLEMGSVWLRLGAKVTVIEAMDRIMAGMDGEVSKSMQRILEKQGMEFHLNTKLVETTVTKTQVKAVGDQGGKSLEFKADKMLVAVGRRAYTEGLNVEAIGLTLEKNGKIAINEHFQTAVAGVYAIGDVIAGPMLAHKAEDEGVACAELLAGKAGHVNYETIPGVIYTWPEVAVVGLTEEQCKEQALEVRVGKFPFMANGRARALGTTDGFVKIIADAATDRIVGAHIIGPTASELISELVVAMEFGASSEDIARSCHAHPTLSEVTKEAALAVDKRALSI